MSQRYNYVKAPPGRTCDFAACAKPATHAEQRWVFCRNHLMIHVEEFGYTPPSSRFTLRTGIPAHVPARRKPAKVAKCGTRSGYGRHLRLHEKPCEPCRDAERAYQHDRQARKGLAKRALATCGTRGAYERHLRLDEEPCQPCREAETDRKRNQRARKAA